MKYVSKVYVSPDSLEMTEGSWYYKASARVEPSDATNPKIRWFSQNTDIASVNPTSGYIYAKAEGTTYICAAAEDGSGAYDCINVTVRKRVPVESVSFDFSRFTIEKGEQKTISATVSPANATDKKLTWSSSDTGVATVAGGVVTAVAHGRAVITATANDGSGKSASCTVTVTEKIPVSSIEMIPTPQLTRYDESGTLHYLLLPVREGVTFSASILPANATDRTVVWSTDNPDVVTVNQKSGYVFGKATGKATIYVRAADGSEVSNSVKIFVITPAESVTLSHSYRTLTPNETVRLSATVSPQNASIKNVQWSSSDPSVATVSNTGLVTAKKVGTAIITAESADGCASGRCNVTITATTTAKYYNIVNKNGKVVNIKGINLTTLTNGKDVILYSPTGSTEQIWRIDEIRENVKCLIRSKVDEDFGLNVYRKWGDENNYNCNIHEIAGNETDAEVYLVSKGNGYYQIELANYSGYKLTAIGNDDTSDIRWRTANEGDAQLWRFESVEVAPSGAQVEYHILSYSNNSLALQVNELNTKVEMNGELVLNKNARLKEDETLQLDRFSYVNKQKWFFVQNGSTSKLYTVHGDNYRLCKKDDNTVYVSDNSAYESDLSIEVYDAPSMLFRIKLAVSGLYLTRSGTDVVWASKATGNAGNQIWKLREKPAGIHNGCDTSAVLSTKAIEAMKNGGEEFVIRYYGILGSVKGVDLKTKPDVGEDATPQKILERTLENLKNVGFDLTIDNPDYPAYVNSIKREDVTFVWKTLTASEVADLRKNQINIVTVYQNIANEFDYFTEENAKLDAFCALVSAKLLGQPENSAIYFGVDFDPENNLGVIQKYFEKVKEIINGKYQIGVYGCGNVCRNIKDNFGDAAYSWLGQGTGMTGTAGYDDPDLYTIKQAENIKYKGFEFDDCVTAKDDYGQWALPA